ncbi:MAG: hypothetical protein IPQ25_16960 [Chitinophagaceae bacterium]|nr:hypothetical protein [Chitinophagaceae bacterium]
MKILKIGAFELPVYASFDVTQRYEPIGGETILRAVSGRGILQRTWRKTRVVTSGGGWVPSGLQSLDFDSQHAVACIAPETIPADLATRQAELPVTRRSDADHVPYGLAQLPGGQTVAADVTLAGDIATVAAVTGAVAYQVGYYPLLTCWLLRPSRSGQDHSWELIAEEV